MTLINILNQIASAFDAMFSKEVIIALVAAWMGANATRKATTKASEHAIKKAFEEEARLTRNTLLLLSVEISAAWDIYQEEYAEDLLKLAPSEPYFCKLPIGNNPFPIYDSIPACLANIRPEMSAKLVRLYMRMKGMISMIELNNKDYDSICQAGHNAVQSFIAKAIGESLEISESWSEKLEEYYEMYIYQESRKLGMGDTADGMKALTSELEKLIINIKFDITNYTNQQ